MGGNKMKEQKQIELKSYAKINLALDIVGKLPNGYHLLDGVMQIIDLYDIVTITLCPRTEADSCSDNNLNDTVIDIRGERGANTVAENSPINTANLDEGFRVLITSTSKDIPLNEDNIVYKAFKKIEEIYTEKFKKVISEEYATLKIHIEKNVPIEAGLAGGSGNGAVTLLGLNQMLGLGIEYDQLCSIGKSIGADVPFSLSAQVKANQEKLENFQGQGFYAARTEGIGEVLTPVTPYEGEILISKPKIGVSTKKVYESVKLNEIEEHINVELLIHGLEQKNFEEIKKNMGNILEKYSEIMYDGIMYTKDKMIQHVSEGRVMMSGSGPTVFAISPNREELYHAYEEMKEINRDTVLTRTIF